MTHISKHLSDLKTKHPGFVSGWVKDCIRSYLRATSKWRALPDFIVLGTPKSGTTSFYAYLSQHKRVIPSIEKEPSYLRDNYFVNFQGYRACFPMTSTLQASCSLTGEGTTTYYYDGKVARRISELSKLPKLFLVVRDPVDRAISQFYHFQRNQRETGDIDEVFNYLLSRYHSWSIGDALPTWDSDRTASDYLKYGIYAHFYPLWQEYHEKGQLKIFEFNDLITKPADVMEDALKFLNLEPAAIEWDIFNKGTEREKHSELKERLASFYFHFNQRFAEQTGIGGGWRKR